MPLPREAGVVVVAAGKGLRVGGSVPKQYLDLAGSPVLLHALRPFTSHPDVEHTVVVLPPEDAAEPSPWLASLVGGALSLVPGGATRRESVVAGLAALPPSCSIVLVHDGARPFPSRALIDAGLEAARGGHCAVPALPVAETIKRTNAYGRVQGTVPREGLWLAQTPQAFPRGLLERAHAAEIPRGLTATDDAMLVELVGGTVDVITGDRRNIKITTAEDLELATWLLGRG